MKQIAKNNLAVIVFLLLTLLGSSCGEREAYYQFRELKNGDWAIDETLFFEIDSTALQPNVPYDISIELTNNMDYPYRNLWISMKVVEEDSIATEKDKEFILADKYAKWLGAGFASLFQTSHAVNKGLVLDKRKNFKVYINHKMQDQKLHGIEKIGIKIKKEQ